MSQRTWIWISNIHFGYQTLNVVNAPENTVWNLGIFLVTHILRKISSIRELPKIHQNDRQWNFQNEGFWHFSQCAQCGNYGNSLMHFWQKFRESNSLVTLLLINRYSITFHDFQKKMWECVPHSAVWKLREFSLISRIFDKNFVKVTVLLTAL